MQLRNALLSVFLFLPILAFSGLAGRYKISGTGTDSSKYKGTAIIKRVGNAVYTATWTFDDGTVSTGTGVLKGNQISFVYQDDPTTYGVLLYKIEGTTLKGPWARFGETRKGFDTLKKI